MRPTVYIETTIPSYYFDRRPALDFEIRRTREWWDEERGDYELLTSEVVLIELSDPRNPNRDACLSLLEGIPSLHLNDHVLRIAQAYEARRIMPRVRSLDAIHLAMASFYRADFLLTWNCRHLANPNKSPSIREANSSMGLFQTVLTTPYDLRRIPGEDATDDEA
jgi:predicted nucleic acid-binding protein